MRCDVQRLDQPWLTLRWRRAKECETPLEAAKGKQILPSEPGKNEAPASAVILAKEIHFGLLNSRTVRQRMCVDLSH